MKTTKKPKILISTWFNCLRNLKSTLAAHNLGYEIELVTKSQGWALASELQIGHVYNHVKIWETPSQLEKAMRDSDADIIWCHNEPDLMTQLACEPSVKRDRLVIHDCHDLPTLHPEHDKNAEINSQEKLASEESDWVFVPTPDYVERIEKKYPKTKGRVKVLYSCAPEVYFPRQDFPYVNGMLYCGQVNVPEMKSQLHYRNVQPLFHKLTSLGVASHIYNTTPNINMMPYTMAGACTYGTLRMYAAIDQYTRYDYGFVGSSVDCEEIQICMPNKLFDCMAAGIPVINLNSGTSGKFSEDLGIGLNIQGLNNLDSVPWINPITGENREFWDEKRKRVREVRWEYTMEKQLTKILTEIGVQ
jgi:hypothetical protein